MPKRPARPFKCAGQWRAVPLLLQCARPHRVGSPPRPVDANPSTASPNQTGARPHIGVHGRGRARRSGRPRPSGQSRKAVRPISRGCPPGRPTLSNRSAEAVRAVGQPIDRGRPLNSDLAHSQLPPLAPHLLQFAMLKVFKRLSFFGCITIISSPHLEKNPTPL